MKESVFIESLRTLSALSKVKKTVEIGEILSLLSGRGYPAVLIVLSLPFCLPIQIPGFSTPFGLLIVFIGLRIAFGKQLWWPKWLLKKALLAKHVQTLADKSLRTMIRVQKFLHPRLTAFVFPSFIHRFNGLLVFALGLLLSLPLPIPFTNMFTAFPLLFIALGTLEDDGLFILVGYFLSLLSFSFFTVLFFWGESYLKHLNN